MSMLDIHDASLRTVNEAQHLFLLKYNKYSKKVYGFTEGKEDPSFYRSIIEPIIPDDWSVDFIRCGKRSKVIDAYNSFDWSSFQKERICFFMDRDLTDYLHEPNQISDVNIYITDGYSIENSVVTYNMCERMLIEIFNLEIASAGEQVEIEALFNRSLDFFQDSMIPLMSQILYWREQNMNAPLDNIKLSNIFDFNSGKISVKFNTQEMLALTATDVGAPVLGAEDYDTFRDKFISRSDCHNFIRGKYILWFLGEFLHSVHKEAPRICVNMSSVPKMSVSVGHKNIIVYASSRARCPKTLYDFINDNYLKYIRNEVKSA
ncbi:DUF4435 domain-containing protein [Rhizobium rhizosphaerae]|uniref:DUF4435 domain-containing protein n=1 Tax=Xaviernesmea rhizosphaerae TaxID=1672749 RepID=UPI00094FDE45|nr:DUF4435 domain-containing protein [Xaviernesmea rhizosphaerae]